MASIGHTTPHEALAFLIWNFWLHFDDISTAYSSISDWFVLDWMAKHMPSNLSTNSVIQILLVYGQTERLQNFGLSSLSGAKLTWRKTAVNSTERPGVDYRFQCFIGYEPTSQKVKLKKQTRNKPKQQQPNILSWVTTFMTVSEIPDQMGNL